ncbi:MAG TPA: hypothetical protein VHP63_06690 [candidate division Zixibacteria bacterium]|nr:hypothetical protein [candidate division Zixibacteria bacterium]
MSTKSKSHFQFYYSVIAVSALLSFGIVSSTHSRPLNLYLSGGISDPSGELANAMEVGYHGAAKMGIQLEPRTEFLFGGEFHSMPTDHNRLPTVSSDFRAIMVGFDVKINVGIPEDPIVPYLLVGGGYANIDFTDTLTQITSGNTFKADSDSQSYFEIGGGFELKRAFMMVRFANIFTEQADGRFISIGIGYKLSLVP